MEENVAATVHPYVEQPVVPWMRGDRPRVAGEPRRNLNALLDARGTRRSMSWPTWVGKALPEFDERRGGFPGRLPAGRWRPTHSTTPTRTARPSVKEGEYRGLDAYPLVSEFLMRFRWEKILTEDGRKYVESERRRPTSSCGT